MIDTNISQQFLSLRKQILEKRFERMNDMQRRAVLKVNGPLLILAGAGSGKTTVVVNRIANLLLFGDAFYSTQIPEGLTLEDITFLEQSLKEQVKDEERLIRLLAVSPPKPWQILAITFTNKAAGELRERLALMLGEETARDITAATFHSACVRILRSEISYLGYDRGFTIYDSDDQQRLVKDCLKQLNLDDKTFPPKMVIAKISESKDLLESPAMLEARAKGNLHLEKIATIYGLYQKKLKESNALDFDDIITLTVRLFLENPEVLKKYQHRFRYISVDEYQDTNRSQYRLISLLAQGHKNLCVVGDDDQSIYRFRGATIENILSFEEQYEGCTVIRLEQNYRSTGRILDAANAVIRHNQGRKGKNLWTASGQGEDIVVHTAYDERDEARAVADYILEHVRSGGKFSDNAVLYRLNAISNSVEHAFRNASIPYRIIGGTRFYDRKEIKDAIAYLSVVNNPADTLRLRRIINEPKRGIGDATLDMVEEIATMLGINHFEVISTADRYPPIQRRAKGLMEFASLIQEMQSLTDTMPMAEMFEELMVRSGYYASLKLDKTSEETRMENLQELKSNMLRYEQETEEPTLAGFLEEVSLYTDLDNYDQDADSVVMMTLHAAKGLEFDNVYIVAFEEGIFPGMRSIGNPEDLEEERRLAYVGITRAKKRLYLMTAGMRMLFGRTQPFRPSRFVEEVPKELTNLQGRRPAAHNAAAKAHTIEKPNSFSSGFSTAPKADLKSDFSFNIGDRVRHKVFGGGIILGITPMGGDHMVEIAFDKVGTKKIMAAFAKLTVENT